MVDYSLWQRFRAWLAYLIFPEPHNWYVEACESANKLEADNKDVHKSNHTLYLRCQELEAKNEALREIEEAAKLYLEHGEPELADELENLLQDNE